MRSAELLAVGIEGRLLDRLRELCQERGWWLRDVSPDGCLRLVRQGSTGVLLIRLGRHLEEELTLLSETARGFPRVRRLVLADQDPPQLAGLAWDLGAEAVLLPPHVVELVELLPRFMPA